MTPEEFTQLILTSRLTSFRFDGAGFIAEFENGETIIANADSEWDEWDIESKEETKDRITTQKTNTSIRNIKITYRQRK